jgi:large subunit ribosomal protein L10
MPKPEKVNAVSEIVERFRGSAAVYFVDYQGLTVAEVSSLRRKLKEKQAELKVAKNTLLGIALKISNLGEAPVLVGPTGVVIAHDDPVVPLKVVMDFAKEKPHLKAKGGLLDGRFFDAAQVVLISQLPSRNEMLAQIIGSLQAPIANLVWALQGVSANLVYTLQAIAEKIKETNAVVTQE